MNARPADPENVLPTADALHNDAHFLRAVTDMAQRESMVASQAIYSASGIKLLEQGGAVDGRLYERLMQHRLAGAIDEHLMASNAVDIPALEAKMLLLSSTTQLGQQLQRYLQELHPQLQSALRDVVWPAQASFKLTVMRHQMPELYEHSVLMMMVAVALGLQQNLSSAACADLAAAALLHDVGMLYMPRSWMNPRHKLTPQETKQLAAHSITGMLVVRGAKVYGPDVENAVLEHHERMDGSGYPRGLQGADISPLGRILMLAEVVTAFYSKEADLPAQRLSLALRMNRHRFDMALVQQVFALLGPAALGDEAASGHTPSPQQLRLLMGSLASLLQRWTHTRHGFVDKWHTLKGGRAAMFVDSRLLALEQSLAESGLHPRQQVDWQGLLQTDPGCVTELLLIGQEALWQIDHCVNACLRRWPQLVAVPSDATYSPVELGMQQWLQHARQVLAQAQQHLQPQASAAPVQ